MDRTAVIEAIEKTFGVRKDIILHQLERSAQGSKEAALWATRRDELSNALALAIQTVRRL